MQREPEAKREVLLQRCGLLEVKAYISGRCLVIACESSGGRFEGISLRVNQTLIRNMIALTKEILKAYEERELKNEKREERGGGDDESS